MGAALSTESRSFICDVFLGDHPVPGSPNRTFADAIAAMQDVLLSGDHYDFCDRVMRPLLNATLDTHNVELLLHYAWSALDHAVCNRSGGDSLLCATLRACQNVVRVAIEHASGDALMLMKLLDTDGVSSKLVLLLVEYIVQVPLDAASARAHSEVLLLLLTYCSTPLHHAPAREPERRDLYVELVLSSDVVAALAVILVQRFVAWGNSLLPSSQCYYVGGAHPSLFNLYFLFGTLRKDKRVDVSQLLGHLSLQLLLVIAFFQKGVIAENTAYLTLVQLADGEHVSYQLLLAAIRARLVQFPEVLLMLYPLMYEHASFLPGCMTSSPGDLREVLVGVLFHLSESEVEANQHMAATIMLIASQDPQLVSASFSWTCGEVAWFTARKGAPKYIGRCSLGSLAVACLTKALGRALFARTPNRGLASVCLGVLANLAPFMHHIDAYPAQRTVAVLLNVTRRVAKLQAALGEHPDAYSLRAELEELSETVVTLAEVLFVAVSGHAAHRANFPLLYELLYHRGHLLGGPAPAAPADGGADGVRDETASETLPPTVRNALRPLLHLAGFYETELASVSLSHTSEEIIRVIQRVSEDEAMLDVVASGSATTADEAAAAASATGDGRGGPPASHFDAIKKQYEELFFRYEEAPGSYSFFAPLLWRLIAQPEEERDASRRPSSVFCWFAGDRAPPPLLCAAEHIQRPAGE